jgi:hypothetical protein
MALGGGGLLLVVFGLTPVFFRWRVATVDLAARQVTREGVLLLGIPWTRGRSIGAAPRVRGRFTTTGDSHHGTAKSYLVDLLLDGRVVSLYHGMPSDDFEALQRFFVKHGIEVIDEQHPANRLAMAIFAVLCVAVLYDLHRRGLF